MSWRLVQGAPCPRPETRLGLAPAATPRDNDMTSLFQPFHYFKISRGHHPTKKCQRSGYL